MKGSLRLIFSIKVSVRLFSSYQNEVGISKSISWGATLCSFAPSSNQNIKRETETWRERLKRIHLSVEKPRFSLQKYIAKDEKLNSFSVFFRGEWKSNYSSVSRSVCPYLAGRGPKSGLRPPASHCCNLHQNFSNLNRNTHTSSQTDLVIMNDVHIPGTSLCLSGIKPAEWNGHGNKDGC